MDKKEKTGVLNVRDLVNVGLFSVLIFIAYVSFWDDRFYSGLNAGRSVRLWDCVRAGIHALFYED